MTRIAQSVGHPGRRPRVCASLADWRALAERVHACAVQAQRAASAGDAALQLVAERDLPNLAHALRGALTGVFNTTAGWSAYEAAAGFLHLARAFAHRDTAPQRRLALAPAVEHAAAFLLGVIDEVAPAPRARVDLDG